MPGKVKLFLLILCGIWSEVIIGLFADENTRESSSHLVRQKRVVSFIHGEDRPVYIQECPYIVNIKRANRLFCVGTILSHRVVVTTAACAEFDKTQYKVVSGSSLSNRALVTHNVTEIKVHYGNHPGRTTDGIALFIIDPAIVFGKFSNKIDLHVGLLQPNMLGIVSGWGYSIRNVAEGSTKWPSNLRSITVPIMAHQNCVNIYRQFYQISDQDICTFHSFKRTGHSDNGAPLVIDGSLVGIFLRRGPLKYSFNAEYPDVFALVQHTDYSRWIRANIV